MKRFLSSFLFLGLLSSAGFRFAPVAFASFNDVSTGNAHYTAITALVEQGVLEGYDDGSFRPDQEVNRAEALKMILLGTGVATQWTEASNFTDVQAEDWFYDIVLTAAGKNIVEGYEDSSFKPEQSVNRAEATKMMTLAAGITVSVPNEAPFTDVGVDDWFASYANYARSTNVVGPQTDGHWHAGDFLTRGEIAEMVYRLQVVQESGSAYEEVDTWTRLDFPTVDITLKVPFAWAVKQEGVGAVFLLDAAHTQVSLLTPYENGGTLLMTRYPNNEKASAETLFSSVIANSPWAAQESTIGGYDALILEHDEGIYYREWYIYLPNQKLVNLVALRGDGDYGPYLEGYLDDIVSSLEYAPSSSGTQTLEEIVAELREAIAVDGVGADMMTLLSDWELIETDSIGVGTGPVDYYYSPSANVTIKYERSFDVILDIREEETSAF